MRPETVFDREDQGIWTDDLADRSIAENPLQLMHTRYRGELLFLQHTETGL